ncbi:hypothetical protein [Hymenobacter glacialis]|uniref:hypothetical protein n=1 Tax=Hymenobacter glacialis TaxID=1908236 RepID=UPI000F7899D3|nr:hypothetical protein [Hymenobacter glacialis]
MQLNQSLNNRLDSRPDPLYNYDYTNDNFAMGVTAKVGREYSRALSRRWTATAGADLATGFKYMRSHVEGTTNAGNGEIARKTSTSVDRYYQVALLPFVGVRYALHHKLYATAEATVSMAYARVKATVEGSTVGIISQQETDVITGNTRYNFVNVTFMPINQILLHYLL